jgi:hypothetical protein
MSQFIHNRIIRSWKSTLIGIVLLIATFYLIYAGTITYEAAAPLILGLWQFFKSDKSVRRELSEKKEKISNESRKMSDTALRDDVQRMAGK